MLQTLDERRVKVDVRHPVVLQGRVAEYRRDQTRVDVPWSVDHPRLPLRPVARRPAEERGQEHVKRGVGERLHGETRLGVEVRAVAADGLDQDAVAVEPAEANVELDGAL